MDFVVGQNGVYMCDFVLPCEKYVVKGSLKRDYHSVYHDVLIQHRVQFSESDLTTPTIFMYS